MDSIDAVYAAIPDVRCKGLCHRACGPIDMSEAEHARITERHGSAPTVLALQDPERFTLLPNAMTCSKLVDKRCSIYADRPLVCRLYGAVRELRCPHGCTPDGTFVANRDARKLMQRLINISERKPNP